MKKSSPVLSEGMATEIYNDEVRCGTYIIAEGFKREHFRLVELVKKYKIRFLRLDSKLHSNEFMIRRIPAKKAGRPVDEIMLNEAQTIFLGTLFRNTERVLDFKEKLAKDFVKQKRIIAALISQRQTPEWIENRALGKPARRNETDTIKDYIEYCKKQGSQNAERYYANLTKVANASLFIFNGVLKNNREAMTANQLKDVKFADKIVAKGLIEGMALEMEYHDIYKMVKDRLISLGEMCGRSEIINKQLQLF